jgi:iron complex transport system substrate-binding protein
VIRIPRLFAATMGILALGISGCATTADRSSVPSASALTGSTSYPLTLDNCGEEVVFESAPERIILLDSAPVTTLYDFGVLDRVVSRAGTFASEYYSTDLVQRLDKIQMLSDEIDASGHLMINAEIVLAQEPDLALGLPEGLTRAGLLDAGVNTLIEPVFCPTGAKDASFESLYEQVLRYGEIFDRNDEASQLVSELKERVATVERKTANASERTAAVLYPSAGGGPLYAYGRASMAQPQLETAGFTNVFDDSSERVFEVGIEELIGRNPDVLILLYQGDDTGVLDSVAGLPGSNVLRALQNDDVLVQLFNFTEPPSPLSVAGLERIVERFGTGS